MSANSVAKNWTALMCLLSVSCIIADETKRKLAAAMARIGGPEILFQIVEFMKPLSSLVDYFGTQEKEIAPFIIPKLVEAQRRVAELNILNQHIGEWRRGFGILFCFYMEQFLNDDWLQAASLLDVRAAHLLPKDVADNARNILFKACKHSKQFQLRLWLQFQPTIHSLSIPVLWSAKTKSFKPRLLHGWDVWETRDSSQRTPMHACGLVVTAMAA